MSEHDDNGFGFGGKDPVPARGTAMALAQMHIFLVQATEKLAQARQEVPSYTGQWSDSDYTAEAQEEFNRAADKFEQAVVATAAASGGLPVKRAMMHAKMAGPWVPYNGSPYAKETNTGASPEALVRFTPAEAFGVHNRSTLGREGVEEPVIRVGPRMKPVEPNMGNYQMGDDEQYDEDRHDYEGELADWKVNPWSWAVQRFGPLGGKEGAAATREAACCHGDAWLRYDGWQLYDEEG